MESRLRNAQIVLDEPRAIYYAGQLLCGNIECEITQPLNFTGINLTFLGKAVVSWSETETEEYNGISRKKEVQYKGREEYFNQTLPLHVLGCFNSGHPVLENGPVKLLVYHLQVPFALPRSLHIRELIFFYIIALACLRTPLKDAKRNIVNTLPPGAHKFPFQYQIPYNVPSTYRSQCGNVTYTITAYIDYPDPSMQRSKLVKEFEVVAPLELNNEDGKRPTELVVEELYSCCCSSSPMTLTISLPVTGYCPGQTIPITVSALNSTQAEVKTIVFQLVKKVGYRSQSPRSELTPPDQVLATARSGAILSKTTRQFTVELVVPSMIAPNLDNCDIMDIGFALKVTAKLSGCNDDLEDETEIILGLVPIPGSPGAEDYKHPLASDLPNAPIPVAPPIVPNPAYPNTNAGYSNTCYPHSNSGYPNSNPGDSISSTDFPPAYPHSTPYPTSGGELPLKTVPKQDIGFVVPVSPTGPYNPPPYSQAHASPYPQQNYPASAPSAPPPS